MQRLRIALFTLLISAGASGMAVAAQGEKVAPSLLPFVTTNAKTVAIEHVNVIDGTGAAPLRDQTVVFSGGVISAVGAAGTVAPPADATVIDGRGKTLMPGYVGMHNHLFTGTGAFDYPVWRSMPFSFPRLYLAAGTTTIRTTGSMDIYSDLSVKRNVDAGLAPGPHVDVTSPYLTGPGNRDPQMDELRDATDATQTVDFWADRGVTSFKVYDHITHAALDAVISEAHRRGLKVMGHLCSVGYREAAALGIDELEHGPYFTDTEFVPSKKPDTCPPGAAQDAANAKLSVDSPEVEGLIADLVARHTPVSSTLPVFESFLQGTPPAIEKKTLALLAPEQLASVKSVRAFIESPPPGFLKANPGYFEEQRTLFKREMAFEVKFLRAGGILTTGPDPSGYGDVIAGTGDWRGIELLVEAGLTPVEAIHVATQNGAVALGTQAKIGTIAVGKNADLILVTGDPSATIEDVENVTTVFKDGVGYDSAKLMNSVKGIVGRQ
jgi:imidazolonepropionase-like amidohydrolase